jgi:glycosyltransferase involved in cell wall biosynthesis
MNDRRVPGVCFVIPSLSGGGAERVAVQLLNALDGERWDRSLFLFEPGGAYAADVSASIRVETASGSSRLRRWTSLRRYLRSHHPDIVVAFLSYLSVLSAARAAGIGTRVAFDVQTPVSAFLTDADYRWSAPWNRRLFTSAMRFGSLAADLIIATSRGVADDLIASFGARPSRVSVVPNPVDVAAIAAAADEPLDPSIAARWTRPVVVAAGRLAEAKNFPLLIESFEIVRQHVTASLFILGQGEQEAALTDMVRARRLGDAVHLCGFQRNPWKYIARADVFALTSRYEGFGNVLVEAMACGVPVVATSSPGTRDIVCSGTDGVVVDHHEPGAFANALLCVLGDEALRGRMAAAAAQKAARYRTDAVARTYDRLLTEALA